MEVGHRHRYSDDIAEQGMPTGFSKLVVPFIGRAVQQANRNDVAALKRLLEGSVPALEGM